MEIDKRALSLSRAVDNAEREYLAAVGRDLSKAEILAAKIKYDNAKQALASYEKGK